jgi:hypothetical protein
MVKNPEIPAMPVNLASLLDFRPQPAFFHADAQLS